MKGYFPNILSLQVSNAQEELLQWHAVYAKNNPKIIHAKERCAAGIIQAIGHFSLGPNISPRDVTDLSDAKLDNFDPAYEAVKFYLFYERWRLAEVENSELYLANLKAVCVCLTLPLNISFSFNCRLMHPIYIFYRHLFQPQCEKENQFLLPFITCMIQNTPVTYIHWRALALFTFCIARSTACSRVIWFHN